MLRDVCGGAVSAGSVRCRQADGVYRGRWARQDRYAHRPPHLSENERAQGVLVAAEVVPILDGAVQYAAAKRLDFGCQDLNQLMARHLAESNPHISITPAHVAGLREQICQVAEDADSYLQLASSCPEEEHQLPDGQVTSSAHPLPLESMFRVLGLAQQPHADAVSYFIPRLLCPSYVLSLKATREDKPPKKTDPRHH